MVLVLKAILRLKKKGRVLAYKLFPGIDVSESLGDVRESLNLGRARWFALTQMLGHALNTPWLCHDFM